MRMMVRRAACAMLFATSALASVGAAISVAIGQTLEHSALMETSRTGLIFLLVSSPGKDSIQGTGFVVSQTQDVLTARHLFEANGQKLSPLTIHASLGSPDGPFFQIPSGSVRLSEAGDFALITARTFHRTVPMSPLPLCWSANPRPGDKVTALGFRPDYEIARGEVRAGPSGTWATTINMVKGFSGGPMFSEDGVVVGVGHAGVRYDVNQAPIEGVTLFSPLRNAAEFLKSAGVFERCVRHREVNFLSGTKEVRLTGTARMRVQSALALPYAYTPFQQRQLVREPITPVDAMTTTLTFGPDTKLTTGSNGLTLIAVNHCGRTPTGFEFIGRNEPVPLPSESSRPSQVVSLGNFTFDLGIIPDAMLNKAWVCLVLGGPSSKAPTILHADDARTKGCAGTACN